MGIPEGAVPQEVSDFLRAVSKQWRSGKEDRFERLMNLLSHVAPDEVDGPGEASSEIESG